MIRFRVNLRSSLFLVLSIALLSATHLTHRRLDNLTRRIDAVEEAERVIWQNRSWRPPADDQTLQFGPRYGTIPGVLWHGQDAWYEREFWVHVPSDQTYEINVRLFDLIDDVSETATSDATIELPQGTHVLRWDFRDWVTTKDLTLWLNEEKILAMKKPVTEAISGYSGLSYGTVLRDNGKPGMGGPTKTRLRVSGSVFEGASSHWNVAFFEIWLAPKGG